MPEQPVNKISELTRLIAKYEPILVNETFTGKYRRKDNKEQIGDLEAAMLEAAGYAIMEFKQFIDAQKQLETNYQELYADVLIVHQQLKTFGVETQDLASGIDILIGRLRNSFKVLHNIAHNLPAEKCKQVAADYLRPLQNPNSDFGQVQGEALEQQGGN